MDSLEAASIDAIITLMATLSPKARDNVEGELYRATASSDEATPAHILETVFSDFVDDLKEVGITLSLDLNEILNTPSLLGEFVELSSYILHNNLYAHVKGNPRIRSLINSILEGSAAEHETTIEAYLTGLAGLETDNPILPDLVYFIDANHSKIGQTGIFTDYLHEIKSLADDERLSVDSDDETHMAFSQRIKDIAGRFKNALLVYEDDSLFRIFNIFLRDLLSPMNFIHYSYLFLNKAEDLPEEIGELFRRRWYQFYVTHQIFPEYYTVRPGMSPSENMAKAMVAAAYTFSPDVEAFDRRMRDINELIPVEGGLIRSLYEEIN
jgi:hypothetical protein